jgi:opine dehydrogenase
MLASGADENTPDRQEAVAADRDIPGKSHRGSVSAPIALVSRNGRGAEYLYTGFTNANAMLHVANCVANAERIESGDSYKFYAEGVTPAVARLYEAINAERVAVAAALGASVPSLADWFDRVYGVREATLVETCQRLTYNSDGPYQATGTPKSLDHKFITEDVPTGLMPMSALGTAAGVRTSAIDTLVEDVRSMTGKDFADDARTLERLGLSGMDGPQIRRVVEQGFS